MIAPRRSGPKSFTYCVQLLLIINLFESYFPHLYNNNHLCQRFVIKNQLHISENVKYSA